MLLVGTLALFVRAAPAGGQEHVVAARVLADLTAADGSARVRVEYELSGAVVGGLVPVRILAFGSASAGGVRGGSAAEVVSLRAVEGVASQADLMVEATDDEGITRVVATYTVASAVANTRGALRGQIPVLTVDRAPGEPAPGLFRAELRLPPSWEVTEGFPTGLASVDDTGVHAVRLSVVPAVVSFRARADGAWRPGMPLILDVLAAVIVGLFTLAGWRHLRRVAS
jgi:hypothetical protein